MKISKLPMALFFLLGATLLQAGTFITPKTQEEQLTTYVFSVINAEVKKKNVYFQTLLRELTEQDSKAPLQYILKTVHQAVTAPTTVADINGIFTKETLREFDPRGKTKRFAQFVSPVWRFRGALCNVFNQYYKPFLKYYPENNPQLEKNYDNFIIQLLAIAQQNQSCWSDLVNEIKTKVEYQPHREKLEKLMLKSALLVYSVNLLVTTRAYQEAQNLSKTSPARWLSATKYYSNRMIDLLKQPAALYFVAEAAKALYSRSKTSYFAYVGSKNDTSTVKTRKLFTQEAKSFLENNMPLALEVTNKIRYEAETSWFRKHLGKIFTGVSVPSYTLYKNRAEIIEAFEAGRKKGGVWTGVYAGAAESGRILLTAAQSAYGKVTTKVYDYTPKQLKAVGGWIQTGTGKLWAKTSWIRDRMPKTLWPFGKKVPAGQVPEGTGVMAPAGDVNPNAPVQVPAVAVNPNAPVQVPAGDVKPDTPVQVPAGEVINPDTPVEVQPEQVRQSGRPTGSTVYGEKYEKTFPMAKK